MECSRYVKLTTQLISELNYEYSLVIYYDIGPVSLKKNQVVHLSDGVKTSIEVYQTEIYF